MKCTQHGHDHEHENHDAESAAGLLPAATAIGIVGHIEYAKGAVVSKTLVDKDAGTVTLFAFDQGQGLSEHTAPFDALVQVVDGEGEFTVGGKPQRVKAGELILMPAKIPHAVRATGRFKMLLVMIRSA